MVYYNGNDVKTSVLVRHFGGGKFNVIDDSIKASKIKTIQQLLERTVIR